MNTETIKLSQIKLNESNPRFITDERLEKLINSLLILPKMLELRPIVVDDTFVALGGNMRYRALSRIAEMSIDAISNRLAQMRDFTKKTTGEQNVLIDYWKEWLKEPTAIIVKASMLSADERQEFVIKDNVGYGEWNYSVLNSDWDADSLSDWGVDLFLFEEEKEEEKEETYSREIVTPAYEPSETTPTFDEMYNTAKRDQLIDEINDSNLADDLKKFLVAAANRHTVFNYEKIADYYSNSPKEVQSLFERSALVIIDFNAAIENGYVHLTHELAKQFAIEKKNEELESTNNDDDYEA